MSTGTPIPPADKHRHWTNFRRELGKLCRKIRAPRGVRELPPKWPQDFGAFTRQLCEQVLPYTMTSKERLATIETATRYVVQNQIPGAFVESGVGPGGSMMAVAYTLLEMKVTDRDLFLYDTYAGMDAPTDADVSILGKAAKRKYDSKLKDGVSTWNYFPLAEVRANMQRTGYPSERTQLIKGLVQNTLPANDIESIALLRLDTNLYESTKVEMAELFPKLSPGGVLIIDDYNRWLGQRKAVDDYLAQFGAGMLLTRIDDHCVQGVKRTTK
jgi:O-methyltransferase